MMAVNEYTFIGADHAHVAVAERALGKRLPKGAVVHHVDGDRANNAETNLVICPSQAYHFLLHARQEALDAVGDADALKCRFCKQWDHLNNLQVFYRKGRTTPTALHSECRKAMYHHYRASA